MITTAGTAKLLHDGVPAGDAGLSHGRAFFGSLPFGDYTLVVEATGYKSTQKDINLSVAMRYEVDANLQKEGVEAGMQLRPSPCWRPKRKRRWTRLSRPWVRTSCRKPKSIWTKRSTRLNHPDVLYAQGVLYISQKNWAQAQSVLEKASQMDPTNGRAFSALGMAFVDDGKYDSAIAPLEKSVQLNSGTWETHWALGRAYYHQQHYDQALTTSQLAWAESKGKEPQIELLVAQALSAVGKYEDAAQALRDFLKHYSDRPEAATARRWLDGLASNGKIKSK